MTGRYWRRGHHLGALRGLGAVGAIPAVLGVEALGAVGVVHGVSFGGYYEAPPALSV